MNNTIYNYIGTVPVKTAKEIMRAFPDVEISGITDENEIELGVPATIDEEVVARLQRIVAVWDEPDDAVLDALFGCTSEKTLCEGKSEVVYIVMTRKGSERPHVSKVYGNQKDAKDMCEMINKSMTDISADWICEYVW